MTENAGGENRTADGARKGGRYAAWRKWWRRHWVIALELLTAALESVR